MILAPFQNINTSQIYFEVFKDYCEVFAIYLSYFPQHIRPRRLLKCFEISVEAVERDLEAERLSTGILKIERLGQDFYSALVDDLPQ